MIGDTIAAVGDLSGCTADRTVGATGRFVTPGFIDMHAHTAERPSGLLSPDRRRRAAQNFVRQGITTGIGNPDGGQPSPLPEQRRQLEAGGIGINMALLNGHEWLRRQVMGQNRHRPASRAELDRMQSLLAHSLQSEGSFGLTTGLEYDSMLYSDTAELVGLARTLVLYGGVYSAHQRSQGSAPMWYKPSQYPGLQPPTLEGALRESIEISETGVTTVVTHIKAWGPGYRGHAGKYIAMLQAARDRGRSIYCDLYPYESAGSDGGFVLLPPWSLGVGGVAQVNTDAAEAATEKTDYRAALDKVLRNSPRHDDLVRDVQNQADLKGGAENIVVLGYPDPAYLGKSIATLMAERHLSLVDLAVALQREGNPYLPGGAKLRAVSMEEQDVQAFYRLPWAATGTDGWIVLPEEAVGFLKYLDTNQRCFGTFVQRIAHVSLEQHVDSLEEAVRKSTSLAAAIYNIGDRGRIAPGLKADLVVLDPARLHDGTSVSDPNVYPTGVDYVWVNGVAVVDQGTSTLALPGRVLDPVGRPAARPPL